MDTVHQLWKPPTSQLPWLCAMRNFVHWHRRERT
jgi:hypothetical protein